MSNNCEQYEIRLNALKEDNESKKSFFKEKEQEIAGEKTKAYDEIKDLEKTYGFIATNSNGKVRIVFIEKHHKPLDLKVKIRIKKLYKKISELNELWKEVHKQYDNLVADFLIKRTSLRKEMQLTSEDYLKRNIDYSFSIARDEERFVMANLLNNFEYVYKITDTPSDGIVHHAAVVVRYLISEEETKKLCGVMDLITGEVILPLVFPNRDSAEDAYRELSFPRSAKAWGMQPNETLESTYDSVLYSTIAIVSKNGKYGICDMYSGDTIIPCKQEIIDLPKKWEKIHYRETSPKKESTKSDLCNSLLKQFEKILRVGQVYFVTNDTRFIDGVMGHEAQGPYGVYSAISGNEIIPTDLNLTFNGCKEVFKELGCPTEPVDEADLYDAVKRVNEKRKTKNF